MAAPMALTPSLDPPRLFFSAAAPCPRRRRPRKSLPDTLRVLTLHHRARRTPRPRAPSGRQTIPRNAAVNL
jgi:hypothetical protein